MCTSVILLAVKRDPEKMNDSMHELRSGRVNSLAPFNGFALAYHMIGRNQLMRDKPTCDLENNYIRNNVCAESLPRYEGSGNVNVRFRWKKHRRQYTVHWQLGPALTNDNRNNSRP